MEAGGDKDLYAVDRSGARTTTIVMPWYPTEDILVSGMFVLRECHAMREAGMDIQVVHLDCNLPEDHTPVGIVRGVPGIL